MGPTRVLKFARSDDDSACVLVQATSKGSKPLDLKLVATEGEAPYVCTLKHNHTDSLRVKGCPASPQEWQDVLVGVFQQKHTPDIQVAATIQSETSVLLTVRKQVQGITQRLGAITLTHDADEAIELFDWCATAVDRAERVNASASEASEKSQSLEETVKQLKAQLDELVDAKRDDEAALLLKFRDLLNEKKVKIREQQKVIAASSPNSSTTLSGEHTGAGAPKSSRKAAPSKPGKRKAKPTDTDNTPVDEDVDVDMDREIKQDPDDSDSGATTEATASDDSDDGEADAEQAQDEAPRPPPPKKQANAPPPRRNLPFQNKKQASAPDDSDDEL